MGNLEDKVQQRQYKQNYQKNYLKRFYDQKKTLRLKYIYQEEYIDERDLGIQKCNILMLLRASIKEIIATYTYHIFRKKDEFREKSQLQIVGLLSGNTEDVNLEIYMFHIQIKMAASKMLEEMVVFGTLNTNNHFEFKDIYQDVQDILLGQIERLSCENAQLIKYQ
ncbi:unnamed protein product [Paramecium pentaurelia]|uniref:Uncharacterized protein n=1 Tax=Paramecium pentaurelia TaxID=43138 RepID=A0A8S1X966_9CILI|nr:unnamed protein product [Paramecium pentaurelia]